MRSRSRAEESRHLTTLRARGPLLLAATLLGALVATAASLALPHTYEAEARLIVGFPLAETAPDYSDLLASQLLARSYAELAGSQLVLARAAEAIGLDPTDAAIDEGVATTALPSAMTITIRAQSREPASAAQLANAVADALLVVASDMTANDRERRAVVDQELRTIADQLQVTDGRIAELIARSRSPAEDEELLRSEERVDVLRSAHASLLAAPSTAGAALTLIDPAVPPVQPSAPRLPLNAGIGAAAALVGALIMSFAHAALSEPKVDHTTPAAQQTAPGG